MLQQLFRGWWQDAWVISILEIVSCILLTSLSFGNLLGASYNLKLKPVKYKLFRSRVFLPWQCGVRSGPFQILSVKIDAFLALGLLLQVPEGFCIDSETT